jgi:outer membrane protein assembly factor BamE (lipoprotein component of BamABCDE complex)
MFRSLIACCLPLALAGCVTAGEHRAAVGPDTPATLTVGSVQKEVKVGMSGAEVAAALGAPNIVSTDEARREVWIYDRISTEYAYSRSSAGILGLVLGFSSSAAGGALPSASAASGAESRTQKTLTVVVKFDEAGQVRDFAYHASTF